MTHACPVWPKIDRQRGGLLDPSLRAHVAGCEACAAEWEAVEQLGRAARDLLRDKPALPAGDVKQIIDGPQRLFLQSGDDGNSQANNVTDISGKLWRR